MTGRKAVTPGPFDFSTSADLTGEQVEEFRQAMENLPPDAHLKVMHLKQPVAPPPPEQFDYRVIITWPAPHPGGALPGSLVSVHDADSGDQIYPVTRLALYASADDLIWARAEMLLGKDGKPVALTGPLAHVALDDDDEPVTGVFSLLVTEMRVAGQVHAGAGEDALRRIIGEELAADRRRERMRELARARANRGATGRTP